jgi:vitamin B12 transporter
MNENGIYGSFPVNFKDTSASQTSMYSSLLYSGHSGLSVELGGRLNTHSRYGSNYTYTFNPAYLISSNWKLYGSIASGFKAPSLYQLYSVYGYGGLTPERSTSYEGGIQYSDAIVESRATYFHRNTKDGIDFNNFTYHYFNRNEEKGQGIEWENKIRFNRMITLSFNYTWLKLKQQTQSHITYNDTAYNYALRTPGHTINFTLAVEPVKAFYISVSGHYESKRFDLGGYDMNFNALPDVTLDGFFLLNAYAEYRLFKGLKLFADAKNITNKKFFTIYGYSSMPAMFSGGAAFEF